MAVSAAAAKARRQLVHAVDEPVRFARGMLRHTVWEAQRNLLRAGARHKRIAVKGCHASSKTFGVAELALWWLANWSDGIVVTTAPTLRQVKLNVWSEIHVALAESRLAFPEPSATQLIITKKNYAVGVSASKRENFRGFHGRILVLIDEAQGVEQSQYEAIEGIRAGGVVVEIAIGNPTIPGGPFYDMFHANSERWSTHSIDAFHTPNIRRLLPENATLRFDDEELVQRLRAAKPELLEDEVQPWPMLTLPSWVIEKWDEWGEGHPLWESTVRADFPSEAENAVFRLRWLERARADSDLTKDDLDDFPVFAGVDPAGGGENETAVVVRRGPVVLEVDGWKKVDPRADVVKLLGKYRKDLKRVFVEESGVGHGWCLHLKDQGFPVFPVNVGVPPVGRNSRSTHKLKERFANLKAQLWWALRVRFESGDIYGLEDEKTRGQLAAITYGTNEAGKIVIEKKQELKDRGIASPDRADALVLAFADLRKSGRISKDTEPARFTTVG